MLIGEDEEAGRKTRHKKPPCWPLLLGTRTILKRNITSFATDIDMRHRIEMEASHSRRRTDDDFIMVEHEEAENPYLNSISSYIDGIHDELRKVSLEIHGHPELQYKEFRAHKVLTEYLGTKSGWKVTPSAYDIQTAFVAVYDSGKKGPVASGFKHTNTVKTG